MPHPTPVQIVYGSAAVVSTALPLLLLTPQASPLAAALIAVGSLVVGVAVALLLRPRRVEPPEPVLVPERQTDRWEAFGSGTPPPTHLAAPAQAAATVSAANATRDMTRPEVRV